jgi:hypothetical protein
MSKEEAPATAAPSNRANERKEKSDMSSMFVPATSVYRMLSDIYTGHMSKLPDLLGMRQGWPCDRGDIFIGDFNAVNVRHAHNEIVVGEKCFHTGYANVPWNGMQAFVSTAAQDNFHIENEAYPFMFTMDMKSHGTMDICVVPRDELTFDTFMPHKGSIADILISQEFDCDESMSEPHLFVGYIDGHKVRFVRCHSTDEVIDEMQGNEFDYQYIPLCIQSSLTVDRDEDAFVFWMYDRKLALNGNRDHTIDRSEKFDGTIDEYD